MHVERGEPETQRKPLVAQSTPATVSGDDNDERAGLIGELSQGINVEDRAALNDPRASPENTDRRRRLADMSNTFLTAAGLPATATAGMTNPYADERDKMRQWLMQRAGVARGSEMSALQSERTRAYLEATQAAKERDLAAQQFRAEQEGRKADAEEFKRKLEEERGKREQARIEEQARHNKALEDAQRQRIQKSGTKAAGPKLPPKGFPAGWELSGDTQPTQRQGEQFEGLVYSDAKMRGLTGEMRKLLAKAGSGRVLPGPEQSRLKQLATQIQIEGKTIAELGALSGPDMALMRAIASDPTEFGSFARDIPALLDGLDSWGANSVNAKAQSLGARRIGSGPAKRASTLGRVTVSNGRETLEIDETDLKDAEKDGYKRVAP